MSGFFKKKKLGFFGFIVVLSASLSVLAHFRTQGFIESKIYQQFSFRPSWEIFKRNQEDWETVDQIISQDFHYLDAGRQCFVFESRDHKWVIKFINHERFHFPKSLTVFPLPALLEKLRKERIERRTKRIDDFFSSFRIGYSDLKDETKILFVQLNPLSRWKKPLCIFDPVGHKHFIDLNKVPFILQRKAEKIYPYLRQIESDEKKFQEAIDSFVNFLVKRIQKGVLDDDLNVEGNIGFFEDQAILIDTGRLFYVEDLKDKENFSVELKKSSKYLHRWLQKEYPKMASYLEDLCNQKIQDHEKQRYS